MFRGHPENTISGRTTPLVTPCYCVIGGAGFVGRAVTRRVSGVATLRLLKHKDDVPSVANAEVIHGDVRDRASLRRLIAPGAVVVNLAYLPHDGIRGNADAARVLLDVCCEQRATRIIHLSTAVVVGRSPGSDVDEQTLCRPRTEYERAKLAVEQVLLDASGAVSKVAVLRPTAVFGPGGKNLLSLAERVDRGGLSRMLYAFAHGGRAMNLVDVDGVAEAVAFLATSGTLRDRETFIVSDDDSPNNNYRWVERAMLEAWGRRAGASALPLPSAGLALVLRLAGQSNVNPRRRYLWTKLASRGYRKPRTFEQAIDQYARWLFQVRRAGGDWLDADS